MHLLTREALDLYLAKLAPGGVLAFHISNANLDLEPILTTLARRAGLACLVQDDTSVTPSEAADGKYESQWVIMARDLAHLGGLGSDSRWKPARENPRGTLWTDDYSGVWPVLMLAHRGPRAGSDLLPADHDRTLGDDQERAAEAPRPDTGRRGGK